MQTGPEKQMISMFEEAIELSSQFKKATYEPTFGQEEERKSDLGLQSGIGDIFYSIAALQPGSRAGGGGGRDDFLLEPD